MLGLMAVDVDGTLIGTGNTVREDVWAAFAQAWARGMRLAICSGRPALGNALAYARRLDADGWHIFQNGASIVKVDSGESLSEPFPADKLQAMIAHAHATGRLLEIYTDTEWAVTHPGKLAERHAGLLGVPYVPMPPKELPGTVVRAQWVVPIEDTETVLSEPHEGLELHPAGSPAMPDIMFISVTKAGVDKGSAVRRVAEKYGLDMSRVMGVGDGMNDLFLLGAVGHPVAMGNADERLKAVAQTVVGHVDDGGMVEAIRLALRE